VYAHNVVETVLLLEGEATVATGGGVSTLLRVMPRGLPPPCTLVSQPRERADEDLLGLRKPPRHASALLNGEEVE
jgi:hypothetical protein